ncbi:MAG: hypothetical protein V2I74_14240, partial [Erythrobacter sp.]|nr:hypothetical protein [Erythrobacter sp.]
MALSGAAPAQTDAASAAVDMPDTPNSPASYERVAKVLVGEKLCRVFGYSIDVESLVDWANDQAALLAEQNEDDDLKDANLRLIRTYRSELMFVRDRWRGGFEVPSPFNYYSSRRFQLEYRNKCDALANAPDSGVFFEKTGEEQDYHDMVANVRDNFMRVALGGAGRPGR